MRRTQRAVVVGGGQNGLAAAITLAERGWDVTVCEANDVAGGAVKTAELTLPGFRHDLYSAVHPAAAASPVFARWPLAAHGLRWVHSPLPMAHPLDDGSAVVLSRDADETAASLEASHSGDGHRWTSFARPYLRHFDPLRNVMLGGFPPVRSGLRLAAGLGYQATLDFVRLVLMPASGLAHELFDGAGSAAWLYGTAMHGDVGPHASGSAIPAVYLKLLGLTVGWPSPAGGADALITALVSHLQSLGGTVRLGTRVDRVIVERGRAVGVEVEGGSFLPADAIVCDLSPAGLARIAGQDLPDATLRRYRHFRPGHGTLKLDWALDDVVPWEAPEARRAGTVHVGGSPEEIVRAVTEVELGGWPERPFLLSGSQSVADATRAPAGKHTAWAYTHTPGLGTPEEIERHVERMEAQMERFAPGFGSRVIGRHVLSPADIESDVPNLKAGDVSGGSFALDQLVFRPVPSLSPYRTPLRNVYLGSASAFPGGAVHGVPGHAAAKACHHDYRARSWVVLSRS